MEVLRRFVCPGVTAVLCALSVRADGPGLASPGTVEAVPLTCALQRLEGRATAEGLWLASMVDGSSRDPLRVRAAAFGRGDTLDPLPARGAVETNAGLTRWIRPRLVEEYSVTAEGIRQDFIIAEKPDGEGDLRVALAVEGARSEAAAEGIRLFRPSTGTALDYHRLHVTDASGRRLDARMTVPTPDRILVHVDDRHATYPVRIDPTFTDDNWVSMGGEVGLLGPTNNPGFYSALSSTMGPDGSLYVGGWFGQAGGRPAHGVARWTGRAWTNLGSGLGPASATVNAMLIDTNGHLYVGGYLITNAGVVSVRNIAKWDGTNWSSVGALTDEYRSIHALAKDSSGNIYAGGVFSEMGGVAATNIAKWNGTSWTNLGSGVNAVVYALACDSQGNLYAGGVFTNAGGVAANNIAKWNGVSWTNLGSGTGGDVRAIAIDDSDHVYVGGGFTNAGNAAANRVARWDGASWSAMDLGFSGFGKIVYSLAFDMDGFLVAGGSFDYSGALFVGGIARWTGQGWTNMGAGFETLLHPSEGVNSLSVDPNSGAIYAIGPQNGGLKEVAKWDGGEWIGLCEGVNGQVESFAVAPDGDLYVGGDFRWAGGKLVNRIARWNGRSWTNLGPGVDGGVHAIVPDGQGGLYIAGEFQQAGTLACGHIARWNGHAWTNLGLGVDSYAWALMRGPVDSVYVGGRFINAGGSPANHVALWTGFSWTNLGEGVGGPTYLTEVKTLIADSGGLIAAGGFQVSLPPSRWDGLTWTPYSPVLTGTVFTMARANDGDVYVGGYLPHELNGVAVNNVVRWDGFTWSALDSGVSGVVHSIALDSNEGLYVGGQFSQAGAVPASGIAYWNGSSWTNMGSGLTVGETQVLALDSGRKRLYAGGGFGFAGGKLSHYLAYYDFSEGGAPEVAVLGTNGAELVDGAAASVAAGTDFGAADLATGLVTRTLVITNSGTLGTYITGVTTSGSHAADFTVLSFPSSLAEGQASNLVVRFNPSATGSRSATLHIANDDADESPYDIQLAGLGTVSPEITLLGTNGALIADGYASPSLADGTDFGTASILTGLVTRTFAVSNAGSGLLTISGVSTSGAHASDFRVVSYPTSIAPGGAGSLVVRFDPALSGLRTAVVSIANNDADENPYDFAVQGTGAALAGNLLAGWNLAGLQGTNDLIAATYVNTGLYQPRLVRGPGLVPASLTNAISSSSWTYPGHATIIRAIASNDYYSITITSSVGYAVSFTNFTWRARRSPNGPSNIVLRSSVDGGIDSNLAEWNLATTNQQNIGTTLSLSATNMVEFRLYGFGAITNSGTAAVIDGANIGQTGMDLGIFGQVHAVAGDLDGDGLPDWWEVYFFNDPTNAVSGVDGDGDGFDNLAEYEAGTDPDDPGSTPVAPLLAVLGTNNATIANNDITPSLADGTDFGSKRVSTGAVTRTFALFNPGTDTLLVEGVAITGTNASDFEILEHPASVSVGMASNMVIRFDPQAIGPRTARVEIVSNASGTTNYGFVVRGTGTAGDVIPAMDKGWYKDGGEHDAMNKNTLTGELSIDDDNNSFFVFDLGSVLLPPTSVVLRLELEAYVSTDLSEVIVISGVTSSISAVTNHYPPIPSDPMAVGIHLDLEDGPVYGVKTVTVAQSLTILEIRLTTQAVSDVAAALGEQFAVGVHLSSVSQGGGVDEWVRFSNGHVDEIRVHELVLLGGENVSGDSDNDGLPDAWEAANGLNPAVSNAPNANADGDVLTDWEEYIADTDPQSTRSFFPPVTLTNPPLGSISLVVDPTSTGRVYHVRWTTNLLLGAQGWVLVPPEQTGSGGKVIFTITNEAPFGAFQTGVRLP